MRQRNYLTENIMKSIQKCDCSHIIEGLNLFLMQTEIAKSLKDIPASIIPLYNNGFITGDLYHYTKADALLSILKSCRDNGNEQKFTLRFSRVDYMNDIYDGEEIFTFMFNECIKYGDLGIPNDFLEYVKNEVNLLQDAFFGTKKTFLRLFTYS